MPKLFGTNILIILLAAFLFFMLGWIWYDMLFGETWMALTGVTMESAEQNMAQSMAIGFLLSLAQATGIAGMMSMKSVGGVATGLRVGALSWMLFGLPITAYSWNYAGTPTELLHIDAGYLLVGYLVMGAVFGLLRKNT